MSQVGGEGSIFITFSFKMAFVIFFFLGLEPFKRKGMEDFQIYETNLQGRLFRFVNSAVS